MALKDFLSLVDDKLRDAFHKVVPDHTKARMQLIKSIDKATKQFNEGKQPRGASKWWSAQNNVVEFTPNLNGKPISIGGKTKSYIPAERFPNALDHLRASVEAGELDGQLAKSNDTDATTPRKIREKGEGGSGKGWSPERRARFEASIAARKSGQS